jgi:hypothetical protein
MWLSAWAELARTYPPAFEALREQLLRAVQRLTGTPEGAEPSHGLAALDDFAEVTAISSRLGEPNYPVELFAHLDAHRPEVAEGCASQARRLLVRAGRFDLAHRYLGDPLDAVTRTAAVFEQRLTRGFSYAPEGMRQTLRAKAIGDYLTGVREIIAVLDGVGDGDMAEQVRHRATEAIHWGHVREDVEAALAQANGTPPLTQQEYQLTQRDHPNESSVPR